MNIILSYVAFAVVATAVNIGTQDAFTRLFPGPHAIVLSMTCGTGAGLVVKYLLDKRYIFQFQTRNTMHDTQTFALYSLMGLATTGIFWGFELAFAYVFASPAMRYAGAVLGLALGYAIKYFLDQRFVFRRNAE